MAVSRYTSNAILLKLDAGASGSLLVTNLSTDLYIPELDETYLSLPEFEIALPDRSAGFEESEYQIEILDTADIVQDLIKPYKFAPVTVETFEYRFDEIGETSSKLLYLYKGRISKADHNINGIRGLVRLYARNDKDRLQFSLGVSCNVQCSWVFGDDNCQAPKTFLPNTVLSAVGTKMIVGTAPDSGLYASGLFKKGYVERNDVRILIRDWISGDTFFLADLVPPSWIGQSITLVSGCDRSIGVCDGIHANRIRFGGLGINMSAHNPIYEEP